jgi:phosphoglycolate phosphatase
MIRHEFPVRFEAVLFDLHGALFDIVPDVAQALNATLHDLGRPSIEPDRIRGWIGGGARALVRQALALLDEIPGPADEAGALARFRAHAARLAGTRSAFQPGVRETLQALRARQIPMGVLSCEDGAYADALLRAHRVAHLFDVAVHADTLSEAAPAPLTVRHCVRELRTVAPRVVLVAGSALGIAAARNAGIASWHVGEGASDADRSIGTISDVVRVVRSPQSGAIERRVAAR